MTTIDPEKRVKHSPTKEFFIFMLTRDLDLRHAVGDLVDNCVDGARRNKQTNLKDLWIRVEVDPKHFKIADNCGGMDIELAKESAFKFGRPSTTKNIPHSIGEFGVGMKRALFKMGNKWTVESCTKNTRFVVKQDVQKWLAAKDPKTGEEIWDLQFDDVDHKYKGENIGTTITVEELHKGVALEFGKETFLSRLREYLMEFHQRTLEEGISISLNGTALNFSPVELLQSDEIEPAHQSMPLKEDGKDINVEIYAGLGDPKPKKAGWYVYCNGRLIVSADQKWTTGWGEELPMFHPEYNRFRGYVFFDSDHTKVLPWNTTKSGIDTESEIYQKVRQEMIDMTKPILGFLNKLKEERKRLPEGEDTPTERSFKAKAKNTKLAELQKTKAFKAPPVVSKSEDFVEIYYTRPKKVAQLVKKQLDVRTYQQVGEETFDYYLRMECE